MIGKAGLPCASWWRLALRRQSTPPQMVLSACGCQHRGDRFGLFSAVEHACGRQGAQDLRRREPGPEQSVDRQVPLRGTSLQVLQVRVQHSSRVVVFRQFVVARHLDESRSLLRGCLPELCQLFLARRLQCAFAVPVSRFECAFVKHGHQGDQVRARHVRAQGQGGDRCRPFAEPVLETLARFVARRFGILHGRDGGGQESGVVTQFRERGDPVPVRSAELTPRSPTAVDDLTHQALEFPGRDLTKPRPTTHVPRGALQPHSRHVLVVSQPLAEHLREARQESSCRCSSKTTQSAHERSAPRTVDRAVRAAPTRPRTRASDGVPARSTPRRRARSSPSQGSRQDRAVTSGGRPLERPSSRPAQPARRRAQPIPCHRTAQPGPVARPATGRWPGGRAPLGAAACAGRRSDRPGLPTPAEAAAAAPPRQ